MRRMRNTNATKVWHNPEIMSGSRPRGPRPSETSKALGLEGAHASGASVGEPEKPADREPRPVGPTNKTSRIVLPAAPDTDPRSAERQRLLAKLLRASGRSAVSQAANDFVRAGFAFPDEQDVHLQLLEHGSEDHVCAAIEKLAGLLVEEAPQRRAVLESRLRRIEQFADEPATRAAAERLRRQVSGRTEGPSSPAAS